MTVNDDFKLVHKDFILMLLSQQAKIEATDFKIQRICKSFDKSLQSGYESTI